MQIKNKNKGVHNRVFGRQRTKRRTPHLSHRVPSLDKTTGFSYVEGIQEDDMHTRFVDTWTRGNGTGQVHLVGKRQGKIEENNESQGGLYRKIKGQGERVESPTTFENGSVMQIRKCQWPIGILDKGQKKACPSASRRSHQ